MPSGSASFLLTRNPVLQEGQSANRERQLRAGLQEHFGSVRIGAQYAAFYDIISSHTEIARWGSCWTQFECGRKTRVLKYSGDTGPLSYSASFTGQPGHEDNDVSDQIEAGVNYAIGDAGLVCKDNFGGFDLGLGIQAADEDFANATDDVTNITESGTLLVAGFVLDQGDTGDQNPQYATLSYFINFVPASLMYLELQSVDNVDDSDAVTIARATCKYDFSR